MDTKDVSDNNPLKVNSEVLSTLEEQLKTKDEQITSLTKQLEKAERQVSKYEAYNQSLREEISKLSSELHQYRNCSINNHPQNTVAIQVTEFDIQTEMGNKPMPEWSHTDNMKCTSIADSLKEAAESILTEQLGDNPSQEGDQHTSQNNEESSTGSDYVFDPSSGLYYHPASGYYWDPNSSLFYDYTTGTYYQFDENTGEYTVHSQLDSTDVDSSTVSASAQVKRSSKDAKSRKKKMQRKMKRKDLSSRINARKKSKQNTNGKDSDGTIEQMETDDTENIDNEDKKENFKNNNQSRHKLVEDEDCEDNENSDSSCSLATGESEMESGEVSSSSSSDVELVALETGPKIYSETEAAMRSSAASVEPDDISDKYPPCIRAIVTESECLPVGSLFIITCTGGTIGRLKNKGHVMEIPDENVSKEHAHFKYDYNENCYKICDLGSQNGTWLNGEMLTKGSGEQPVCHGDEIHLCSTRVVCHIHKGSETCDDCEPGQVQAKLKATQTVFNDHVVLSKVERQRNRRNELKKIKKKYGLQNAHFEDPGSVMPSGQYTDKAQLRRQHVGSDVEGASTERPASVHQPVSSSNKGHKLLAKMGWKEGQGLGKNNTGIAQPINVELRVNSNAGLGSASNVALSLDNVQTAGKAKRWSQARQRFQNISDQGGGHGSEHRLDTALVSSRAPPQHSAINTQSTTVNSVPKTASKTGITWHRGEVQLNDFPNALLKDGGDMSSVSQTDRQISGVAESDTRIENS